MARVYTQSPWLRSRPLAPLYYRRRRVGRGGLHCRPKLCRPGFGLATGSDTISGWTVGDGVEYAFTNNWTGRVEHLFYDLDDSNIVNVGIAPNIATTTLENRIHVIRLGVNYKF